MNRMGSLVYDNPGMVEWAAQRIHFEPRSDVVAVGYESDGSLRCVVLYDGFSVADCNIHIASDGTGHWLTRGFLRAAFAHPFIQWNLRRVTGLVPAKNSDALRFDQHLGFVREGYIRHALPDDDIIVMGMLREDCRFIPKKYRS